MPRRRGRPSVPIEDDPDRYRLAAWRAFHADGYSSFNASRLALFATDAEGGPITIEDIEGLVSKASASRRRSRLTRSIPTRDRGGWRPRRSAPSPRSG
jgi:hypothetical protein